MSFVRFNLLFIPLVTVSLGGIAYFAYTLLQENAREQVTQNAQIMMEVASSSRIYTTKQVQPLLQHKNFKLQTAIEEFRKALDDLPKDAEAIRVPESLDLKEKTESGLPPPTLSASAEKGLARPAPPDLTLQPELTPRPPDSRLKSTPETPERDTSTAVAKPTPVSSSREQVEPSAKKTPSLWRRLFGGAAKEESAVTVKDPAGVPPVLAMPSVETKASTPLPTTSPSPVETQVTAAPTETREVTKAAASPVPAGPTAKEGFLLGRQRALEEQKKYLDSLRNKPDELIDTEFHPQSVPAYAATEIFNVLRQKYPNYYYKEATLNPTNLRDRTSDWEADIVNSFRANPNLTEFTGTRSTPSGDALFLTRPIRITNVSCLACHSTPDKAPPEMISQYGPANGFGWKMDEVIGAQVVTVPTSVSTKMAENSWVHLTRWLFGAFAGIIVAGNLGFSLSAGTRKVKE